MLEEIKKLMSLFKGSFINYRNELILAPRTNLYFNLDNVDNLIDLTYKVFAYCSRDAYKREPFRVDWRNHKYQDEIREKLNNFLGVDFSKEIWGKIYCQFGNGCNEKECLEFIKSDFDFKLLEN